MRIVPFADLTDREPARRELQAIFFAGAATKSFASGAERDAYSALWLGRYLTHFPEWTLIAIGDAGMLLGYLAGSPVSNEPPLSGPGYYDQIAGERLRAFPAHCHVNVRRSARNRQIGRTLTGAFQARCRQAGLPGSHIVTSADSGASRFFEKAGYQPEHTFSSGNKMLVLMTRPA